MLSGRLQRHPEQGILTKLIWIFRCGPEWCDVITMEEMREKRRTINMISYLKMERIVADSFVKHELRVLSIQQK